jgi:hypothetical protein
MTPFQQYDAPAWGGQAISPGSAVLSTGKGVPFRALYVSTGGNITIRLLDGSTQTFVNVLSGTTLRLQFDMISAATASNLIGLY